MKYRFKSEDFLFGNVEGDGARIVAQASADRANAKLEQWEKESEKVFSESAYSKWDYTRTNHTTHEAILWNPRKIGEK